MAAKFVKFSKKREIVAVSVILVYMLILFIRGTDVSEIVSSIVAAIFLITIFELTVYKSFFISAKKIVIKKGIKTIEISKNDLMEITIAKGSIVLLKNNGITRVIRYNYYLRKDLKLIEEILRDYAYPMSKLNN